MSNHPTQPTILVKKSDGTSVRMTLDEVKAMKNEKKPHPPRVHHQKKASMPNALATTAPVSKIFVDEAAAKRTMDNRQQQTKPWKRVDASSPLEEAPTRPTLPDGKLDGGQAPIMMESPEKITETTPLGPGKEVAEKVLKKAGWDLSDATKNRLTPLIVSRVKEVRTDGQFLVHAMTPTHRGGVGLSPAQAEQLLAAIQSFLPQASGMKAKSPQESNVKGQMSNVPTRPVMRDVTPPSPAPSKQMGPKEEFAAFSLADFKRLGATTDAALSRLKEKFDTLKAESYILFLDVRDAWFQSPLTTSYVEKVLTALREKKKLSDVLAPAGSREDISMDVVKAIMEVNKYISV